MNATQQTEDPQALDAAVAAVTAAAEAPHGAEDDLELLDELAKLQAESAEETFADISELFETEHREQLGVWIDWPAVPGARVHIAHFSACADKREELERRFRERHQVATETPLSRRVSEALWRECFFGTVVKGWSGLLKAGQAFEFNERNFRELIQVRRFRAFVRDKSTAAEAFRAKREEGLRGNSPAA